MGVIGSLLTLPLAPVKGVTWVAGVLQDEAERQLYDEDAIRRELAELEWVDEDEMTQEERHEREEALLERLAIARERHKADREEMGDV